jgi:hypothetical protein
MNVTPVPSGVGFRPISDFEEKLVATFKPNWDWINEVTLGLLVNVELRMGLPGFVLIASM